MNSLNEVRKEVRTWEGNVLHTSGDVRRALELPLQDCRKYLRELASNGDVHFLYDPLKGPNTLARSGKPKEFFLRHEPQVRRKVEGGAQMGLDICDARVLTSKVLGNMDVTDNFNRSNLDEFFQVYAESYVLDVLSRVQRVNEYGHLRFPFQTKRRELKFKEQKGEFLEYLDERYCRAPGNVLRLEYDPSPLVDAIISAAPFPYASSSSGKGYFFNPLRLAEFAKNSFGRK